MAVDAVSTATSDGPSIRVVASMYASQTPESLPLSADSPWVEHAKNAQGATATQIFHQ
jgi:hypothetical protein